MIAIVIGTRPEIIKMSPIIRLLEKTRRDYFVVHTGQHYSYEMDRIFFEELKLPLPEFNLDVGSGTHAEQTAKILAGTERMFEQEKPDIVLVQGDTNSVLAGALAATKMHIAVGHVEAGLRSYDRRMPEEINRVLTDHIAEYLFVPTQEAQHNALIEGIDQDRIYVTGNTIVDSVLQNIQLAETKKEILTRYDLKAGNYFLITSHRQENVDNKIHLANLFKTLEMIHDDYLMPIIFPMHPRTEKRLKEFRLTPPRGITVIPPTGFLEFLILEANARLVLTDSGGVQEETCILKVPCVTLRENTERPETVNVGSNILAGTDPDRITRSVRNMLEKDIKWKNPFGDGKAAERIIHVIS